MARDDKRDMRLEQEAMPRWQDDPKAHDDFADGLRRTRDARPMCDDPVAHGCGRPQAPRYAHGCGRPQAPRYAHVKVVVTTSEGETVYDMPKVENFAVETDRDPAVKLSFTMRPQSTGDQVIMTVETRKIYT